MKHNKDFYRSLNLANGYQWYAFERQTGKHLFKTGNRDNGYYIIKATDDDIAEGMIYEQARHHWSNENKAELA